MKFFGRIIVDIKLNDMRRFSFILFFSFLLSSCSPYYIEFEEINIIDGITIASHIRFLPKSINELQLKIDTQLDNTKICLSIDDELFNYYSDKYDSNQMCLKLDSSPIILELSSRLHDFEYKEIRKLLLSEPLIINIISDDQTFTTPLKIKK